MVILSFVSLEAQTTHHKSPIMHEWKEENLNPFDELMLSWNTVRPSEGKFLFYVSVKTDTWSPWLLYASWGNDGQSSFLSTTKEAPVKVYQDALEMLEGKKATGFQIKINTEGNANLSSIHGLHVYTNSDKSKELQETGPSLTSLYLKVPGLSQMALNHVRHADLCSPTSTTAVTQYLANDYTINPLFFAQQAWDSKFDIFGNWVFNVAQASTHLGDRWNCWVERLNGFNDIHSYINQGTPVIVSVRGPLPGSAQPYDKGHLLAAIGYVNQKVICMDPAFPTNSETHVSYALSDFVQAWSRRGNVAYYFYKKIIKSTCQGLAPHFSLPCELRHCFLQAFRRDFCKNSQ